MAKTKAEFEAYIGDLRRKGQDATARATAAFNESPAVIVTSPGSRPELWILSGNTRKDGDTHRLTFFMDDGPRGHQEGTVAELMKENASSTAAYKPVGDAEVIAWTSTPEFERGSKHVAYIQALNELGWLQSKAVTHEDKKVLMDAMSKAQSMDDVEKATAFMGRVIHAHTPRKNPSSRRALEVREADFDLVPNPTPWVTHVLAAHFTELEEKVPAEWLPKIAKARAVGTTFTGELTEFGCGAFGCVLPTLDPKVVLKVTSDESEAEFAATLADKLPTPVCTAYYMAIELEGSTRGPRNGVRGDGRGQQIYLLWREEAQKVGQVDKAVGQHAEQAIHAQHSAAMSAFLALQRGENAVDLLERWRDQCRAMGKVKELAFVSDGLLRAFDEQGIFISDTHGGNLGLCLRNGSATWVITDPGNVVVMTRASSAARQRSR